ncbi:FG-GAP-like repeat-containing protein [Streptomyces sp. DSM 41524]|uniref:FG-GAP-like repeat-containing protein n=1 Tax=Streptomyces asiaticus subsp. ignotus TaxID=3098222 RepID=A0ABU7PU69_9ACTN|nr:FG-GAP-like repeat-containing protein [Streptomyces sp. DASNCL29]MEE4592652.1 FG-GAP-like repeat-containing protein [Streptomyces sp. DSM 41524]TMU96833.1 esterase [Streptomyces sp. DASNCL29]
MRPRSLTTVVRCATVAALVTTPALLAVTPAAAAEARPAAAAAPKVDFNKDGRADLAVSAPTGTVGGKAKAGYVAVVYGSASGADTAHRQVVSQATEGVPGDPAASAYFGAHTVARDLDGDGYTDLAVQTGKSPALTVLWGSPNGLTGGTQLPAGNGDHWGDSVITGGDFNGDGHADLVDVVTTGEGSDDEKTGVRVRLGPFTRDGKDAGSSFSDTGRFDAPTSLTAGDITGDGKDDLVSTHAFEEMSQSSLFFKGDDKGLSQKAADLTDAASATIGDVDKDGHGDLVLRTVPGDVIENLPYDHGTLKVLYGTASGPSTTRTTTIDQNTAGVPGVNEDGDQFGYSLSSGDVNGDGYADIAVGIPYEGLDSVKEAGSVVQLYGGRGGLSGTGAQAFTQDTAGVPGVAEAGDHFAMATGLADTDGDGKDDLAVGAPDEDGAQSTSGAAWALRGQAGGLTTSGVVSFGPDSLGAPEAGAALGHGFQR